MVVSKEGAALKSARNIAGVDICQVNKLSTGLLAPGGKPGRTAIWSEGAISGLQAAVAKIRLDDFE